MTNGDSPSENGQRKRRSRWGASDTKINIPGLPTAISSTMSKEQREQYSGECLNSGFDVFNAYLTHIGNIVHLRIEEINRKLRTGDIVPHERDR